MSLRLKIHLIVGVLVTLFMLVVIGLQLRGARDSVREEVEAANRVASQLLNRTVWLQAAQGNQAMLAFLHGLGRVRANEILLYDAAGAEVYRSPPSPYKSGRDAPEWFEPLVAPPPTERSIGFPDGRLAIRADPSRAILDAWDQLVELTVVAALLLVAINVVVHGLVGGAVRPFRDIVGALGRLEGGELDVRLPPLAGSEAATIGQAFNRMAAGVGERIEAERRVAQAERELSDRRDLARWIDRHLEQERRLIARELHDELGQSVTGIRSLALSVAQRVEPRDADAARAARVIADESSRLYDAMHGLIPRLAPLVLDVFGLADALRDLAERSRVAHPQLELALDVALSQVELGSEATLAVYRAAQEGLTNALRHGQARKVRITLAAAERGGEPGTRLVVRDDGRGLAPDWQQRARTDGDHYGLRWLTERVEALGGALGIANAEGGGVALEVWLPAGIEDEEPAAVMPQKEVA
ncbi:MAG TPA: ATP-binding protein [Methylibium sp.]|uniref:ATP-binding protein n=1 Tax=Methylibium sp. TaxID=2067992 RepID=UPI002DB7D022|nr:ATP-binding protein [Methylibium sp.]HEU4458768.1 ATP-binding protein [Methylibium sp.]